MSNIRDRIAATRAENSEAVERHRHVVMSQITDVERATHELLAAVRDRIQAELVDVPFDDKLSLRVGGHQLERVRAAGLEYMRSLWLELAVKGKQSPPYRADIHVLFVASDLPQFTVRDDGSIGRRSYQARGTDKLHDIDMVIEAVETFIAEQVRIHKL